MRHDKSILLVLGAGIAMTALVLLLALVPSDATPTRTNHLKCDKACQQSNDYFLHAHDYRDYFVADSDGSKDMIFSDFTYEPFEGVKCRVIKNDSGVDYLIAGWICMYNGQLFTSGVTGPMGPQGRSG